MTDVANAVTCPAARDATETGGGYALYGAPAIDGDPLQPITCVVK